MPKSIVGLDQDFFRLGGHSLVATQVISRLSSACGIDLPIGAIFEAPTVARLAGVVESTRNGEPAAAHAITRLGPARAAQLLERLEEFSEAEIEELLRDPEFKDVI